MMRGRRNRKTVKQRHKAGIRAHQVPFDPASTNLNNQDYGWELVGLPPRFF
jgi:hypothetical protein